MNDGDNFFEGVTQENVRKWDDATLRLNLWFGMKALYREQKEQRADFPVIAAGQAKIVVDNAIAACVQNRTNVDRAQSKNTTVYLVIISGLVSLCTFLAGVAI